MRPLPGRLQCRKVSTPASVSAAPRGVDRVRRALLGGHPIIYIQTWEEARVERLAQHLAKTFYGQPAPLGVWSLVDGLVVDGTPVPDTRDPLRALETILAAEGKGCLLYTSDAADER